MITIRQIGEVASAVFSVPYSGIAGTSKGEANIIARHCVRALAMNMGYTPTQIAVVLGGDRSTVYNSKKIIFTYGQLKLQYRQLEEAVMRYIPLENETYSDDGIKRVTLEAYDERFYSHAEKINPRTENHWFPAYHFLWKLGAPMSPFLIGWYKEYGHEADRIMKHKERMGSFVHDRIEQMSKHKIGTSIELIEDYFKDPGDVLFVKRCFEGFLNFMKEHDAYIVSSEKMILGEDWGGTMDLELRIKDDGYKAIWVVDAKTSKSVFEEHLIQVETYRRTCGADRGAVLILGNQTKKRYTFTEVPVKKQDMYYKKFLAAKEFAYITMLDRGIIAPTEEVFPKEFKLNDEAYEVRYTITNDLPVQEAGDGEGES